MNTGKMTTQEKREILIEQDKEQRKLANEQREWFYKIIKKDSSLRLINTL